MPSRGPPVRGQPVDPLPVEGHRARRAGGSWPPIRLNSVDLPAPFGPMTAAQLDRRDVEVDVAHGVDAPEGPGRHRGRVSSAAIRVSPASSSWDLAQSVGTNAPPVTVLMEM